VLGALAGFGASKAAPASSWGKWASTAAFAVGGAVVAGAAVGTTYYKREELGIGYSWATDHMKYIGNLWDMNALNRRVDFLVDAQGKEGIVFRNFYTYLPATPLVHDVHRTFIDLPKKDARAESHFVLARNGLASDEVDAHTTMFSGKSNDGYYDLGLETAKAIREAVMNARGVVLTDEGAEKR